MAGTENRKWCLLDSRMCFPVTPLLGACLKLNVAIKEQWQPSKISKSPLNANAETFASYSHLLPSLDQCPEKISDLKSFSPRHFQKPHLQSTFSWGKHSPTEGRPWHPGGELLHTGDFHAMWNMQSQKQRTTETMTTILKCQTSSLCGIFHQDL